MYVSCEGKVRNNIHNFAATTKPCPDLDLIIQKRALKTPEANAIGTLIKREMGAKENQASQIEYQKRRKCLCSTLFTPEHALYTLRTV